MHSEDQRALKSPGACRKLGFLKSLWPGMSRLGPADGFTKLFPLFPSHNADPCPHRRFAHSGGVASLCKISLSPLLSLRIKSQTPNLVMHPYWVGARPKLRGSSAFFSSPSASARPFLSALLTRWLSLLRSQFMSHYFWDPPSVHRAAVTQNLLLRPCQQ